MYEETIRLEFSRRTAIACLVCAALGAVGYSVSVAFADDDPATQNLTTGDLVVPYDGHLRIDGMDANGTARIRFELFQVATGGVPVWSEEQTVTLNNGEVSVGLGTVTRLNEVVLDAQKLWLGLTILEDDGQGGAIEVPLSGRQSIGVAPYASWSAHAADLQVASGMTVGGDAVVGAGIQAGGDLRVEGTAVRLGTGDVAGLGDGGKAMAQGPGDVMLLNPDGDFSGVEGGAALVADALDVDGDAVLGDDAASDTTTLQGDLIVEGPWTITEGLELPTSAPITEVESVRGVNGLALRAVPGGSAAVTIDSAGNVTVSGDLNVGGRLTGWTRTSGSVLDDAPGRNFGVVLESLGLGQQEGFCYLSQFRLTHTGRIAQVECHVSVGNPSGWSLINNQSSFSDDKTLDCSAICVRY